MSEEKVMLSNQQPTPGDPGYTPPAAAVPLPSQGKVYPQTSTLFGKELVEIKAMTAKEEDILTSRGLLKAGKALDALLRSCILDRSIDVDSMLVGDRNAALIAIRITGYGQEYKVQVECPKCDNKSDHEFDLAALPVKRLGIEPRAQGVNEFSFQLPVSRKEVVFKLLTGVDERDLSANLDKSRKISNGLESLITTRLLTQIISVGGESDKQKLSQIVRNLPARDSRDLRAFIEKISPGVEMKQLFKCPSCSEESEVDVPMGIEFFWPKS